MIAISHPFTLDTLGSPDGKSGSLIKTTTDTQKIYLDRVNSVLSTMIYKRPMRTQYGTDMARALYESGDDYYLAITEAIARAMALYLPDITVVSLTINEANSIGQASVELLMSFPDDTVATTVIKTAALLSDGTNSGDIY